LKKILLLLSGLLFIANVAFAAQDKVDSKKGVKYRKGKKIDFESLLIQGEKKRAEILVVTGDAEDDLGGLLRLRENFQDHQADDFGEDLR
jgi:hypothetical protein